MGLGLPAIEKTWQYYVNKDWNWDGTPTFGKQKFLSVKIGLTTFASAAWTIEYSCDGSTAGSAGDGVDRWGDDIDDVTSLVHVSSDSSARSWIVLKQSAIASNFQILIDLVGTTNNRVDIYYSYSEGFTGGAIDSRPTATDEFLLCNDLDWGTGSASAGGRHNVVMSNDGEVTRVFFVGDGNIQGFFSFELPKNIATGWTTPHVCINALKQGGTSVLKYADILEASTDYGAYSTFNNTFTGNSNSINCFLSSESSKTFAVSDGANQDMSFNQISKKWEMYPVGFYCDQAPFRGRHATLYDMWFIASSLGNGRTIPKETKDYVVLDDICIPWNNTTLKIY